MAQLLGNEVREEVRERLAGLEGPVRVLYFTEQYACGACAQQRQLLEELAALSEKIV
ncbi:MAG TPA: hypothetical protein VND24_10460 [Steroidobacteraceae bacterium]|nr:hypothetical protein [Steroidobacteraceae bacterium]